MLETRLEVQQSQKLSQSLQVNIHLLSLDLDDLSAEMRKAVEENPALEYVPPKRSIREYTTMVRGRFGKGSGNMTENCYAGRTTVLEELEQQLRLNDLPQEVAQLAHHMLHLLSPRGYFVQPIEEFAAEAGVSIAAVYRALKAIQDLEPPGIGAQNVSECLELQLEARPDTDPLCIELVRQYLVEMCKGNFRLIARETGTTVGRIHRCVEMIRTLSPAPCDLWQEDVQYVTPEFSVETAENGEPFIVFHNDFYPTLRQDNHFRSLTADLKDGEKAYAKRMLSSASQFINAVENRQRTMEKVAQLIVSQQRSFFLNYYSLVPLRIDEAAQQLGVHETTLYRVIQGKYLYCARGIYPLSHFFQREVSGGVSTEHVKELIRDLCRENGSMSDREITEILAQKNIVLSRRTVAKYRLQMEINPSFRRKGDAGHQRKEQS